MKFGDFRRNFGQLLELYRRDRTDTAKMFDEIDVDGSGYLDSEELRELMKRLNLPLEHNDVLHCMLEMDSSGTKFGLTFDGYFGYFRMFDGDFRQVTVA